MADTLSRLLAGLIMICSTVITALAGIGCLILVVCVVLAVVGTFLNLVS